MPKMSPVRHPAAHEAQRDTMWVGKGVSPAWAMIAGLLAAACLLAWWMH